MMRASKALVAAGLAACAAPAMACDLEAFGEQRFSAFGGMHGGAPQAPGPAAPDDQSQQQQSGDQAGGDQSGGDQSPGDAPNADGGAEPAYGSDVQGDAATFR